MGMGLYHIVVQGNAHQFATGLSGETTMTMGTGQSLNADFCSELAAKRALLDKRRVAE
jgi:hypothetical protein